MVADLEAGNYTVPVTAGFNQCRAKLPWWHGLPPGDQPLGIPAAAAAPGSDELPAHKGAKAAAQESAAGGNASRSAGSIQQAASKQSANSSQPADSKEQHDRAPVPAVAPAGSAEGPADGQNASTVDPRWLTGPAADLPKCLRTDGDDVPATAEGILAGELPR